MKLSILCLVGAAANSRVFNYWGTQAKSNPTTVWGDPVKGIDITGNSFNGRNGDGNDKNGHHGYRTKMGDHFVHTSSTEGEVRSMTNCEGLHSSAKNTNHCLIGGKCGPCPVQTQFPTPAPTPAPTVEVPHRCMRTGNNNKVKDPVAFGWAGVGSGIKYCFLEHCKMCTKPTTYTGYGSELFCPMKPHQDASPDTGFDTDDTVVRSGVCGKHEFTDTCEFVTCTYTKGQGMKVTVAQGDRGLGLFANNGKFLTGDQHECRSTKGGTCTCKCSTTGPKVTLSLSVQGYTAATFTAAAQNLFIAALAKSFGVAPADITLSGIKSTSRRLAEGLTFKVTIKTTQKAKKALAAKAVATEADPSMFVDELEKVYIAAKVDMPTGLAVNDQKVSPPACLRSQLAIDAEIVAPMVARDGYVWFEGNEITVPKRDKSDDTTKKHRNDKCPTCAGGVKFQFEIKKAGTYTFQAELIAANNRDDSFYVATSVDNAEPYKWDVGLSTGLSTDWTWGDIEGIKGKYFSAGTHSITLKPREDGTKVRALKATEGSENVCFKSKNAFLCDFKKNFISGQRYSQISLTDYCRNGVCNSNPKYGGANSKDKAIAYCKKTCNSRSGCTGFFFQTHGNGHEICGFYTGTVNKDVAQWHGHKNGAICLK